MALQTLLPKGRRKQALNLPQVWNLWEVSQIRYSVSGCGRGEYLFGHPCNLKENRDMEDAPQLVEGFFTLRVYMGSYIPETSEMAS